MTFEEIKELVTAYGSACEDFGDYQSTINGLRAALAEKELLEAIKKLCETT